MSFAPQEAVVAGPERIEYGLRAKRSIDGVCDETFENTPCGARSNGYERALTPTLPFRMRL